MVDIKKKFNLDEKGVEKIPTPTNDGKMYTEPNIFESKV